MAAEKVTEVSLESIRLLEVKGRTVTAEPISTYVQVLLFTLPGMHARRAICFIYNNLYF